MKTRDGKRAREIFDPTFLLMAANEGFTRHETRVMFENFFLWEEGRGNRLAKWGLKFLLCKISISLLIWHVTSAFFFFFFDFERNVIYYNFDLLNLGIKKFMYYVNYNVLYLVNFEM